MAWGTPTSIGSVAGKTGSSLVLTTTAGVPAGAMIVAACAETVSASGAIGAVTDSAGNTYSIAVTGIQGISARLAIQFAENVTALPAGSTITLAHGTNNDTILSAFHVTGQKTSATCLDSAANATATQSAANPAVTSAAMAEGGELVVAATRYNAASTDTLSQDTGGGWAFPPDFLRTSGAASQLAIGGGYTVNSGTSAVTWSPTIPSSHISESVITAFKVAAPTSPALRPHSPNTMRHLRR